MITQNNKMQYHCTYGVDTKNYFHRFIPHERGWYHARLPTRPQRYDPNHNRVIDHETFEKLIPKEYINQAHKSLTNVICNIQRDLKVLDINTLRTRYRSSLPRLLLKEGTDAEIRHWLRKDYIYDLEHQAIHIPIAELPVDSRLKL